MKPNEKLIRAVKKLSKKYTHDKITYAKVAKEAGVHWTTVRRHFGSKENLKKMFLKYQDENHHSYTDTRTKILESAEKTFAKHGYEKTTLDQIANNANLTKGAVYWHFSSKSDLFLALIERSFKKLIKELPKQKEIFQSANPVKAFQSLFENEIRTCIEEKNQNTLLFLEFISKRRDQEVQKKLNHFFLHLFQETSKIIEELQQEGHLPSDLSPYALSIILQAMMNGMVLMAIAAPNQIPIQTISEDISKVFWKGLLPKDT